MRKLEFEFGYQVLAHLRKNKFPRGTYNKLKLKKIGSCKILRKFGENDYEIELKKMWLYCPYSTLWTCILRGKMEPKDLKIRRIYSGKSRHL
jgi:hypothetical protein